MRVLLIIGYLVFITFYPPQSLAEIYSELPVFGDRLFIVSQPPKREPHSSFVTVRELDAYYGQLLIALKRRQPEADALYFVKKGQRYLLQTNAKMTREQQIRNQPTEVLVDNAVSEAVNRVCPWAYNTRIIEGEADSQYIDFTRLTKILNKQELAPKGEKLLPISLTPTTSYPTKMVKLYQQVLADYVSRWNSVMYAECKRIGGAPDITKIAPVRVTHKPIGNTVFILDELPFAEPRPHTQSELERAIYGLRLAKAMRQKNVETDLKTFIRQQQTYFLGMRIEAVADWFGSGVRPKSFKPRYISYRIEEENIDDEEVKKLARVCPVRMLEGRDVLHSGQIGTIDFTNYPNAQSAQPHAAEMNQLFKNIRNYEKRWNQTMLPICREKLKKQK